MFSKLINYFRGPRTPKIPKPQMGETVDGRGDEFTELIILDEPNGERFVYLANYVQDKMNGKWTKQLEGLDQVYWDLETPHGKIVFHQEHYIGIMVHPHGLSEASQENQEAVRKAYEIIMDLYENPIQQNNL